MNSFILWIKSTWHYELITDINVYTLELFMSPEGFYDNKARYGKWKAMLQENHRCSHYYTRTIKSKETKSTEGTVQNWRHNLLGKHFHIAKLWWIMILVRGGGVSFFLPQDEVRKDGNKNYTYKGSKLWCTILGLQGHIWLQSTKVHSE